MRPNLSHLTLLKHNNLLRGLRVVNLLVIHSIASSDIWTA